LTCDRSPKQAGEAHQAASPLYLRKSYTFPKVCRKKRGSAAVGGAANDVAAATVKPSFTANRKAEPD